MRVSPARPELAVTRSPPAPPLPPTPVPRTVLVAAPVLPDVATAVELAPLFDSETAVPVALASPVGPELPVSPDVAAVSPAGVAAWVTGCGAAVVVVVGAASAAGPRS